LLNLLSRDSFCEVLSTAWIN